MKCINCETPTGNGCKHVAICEDCRGKEINNWRMPYGICFCCILDGDADLIVRFVDCVCWGGNFYECVRPANVVMEFGRQYAIQSGEKYEYDKHSKIKWTGSCGDPSLNVASFRDLYDIGFFLGENSFKGC